MNGLTKALLGGVAVIALVAGTFVALEPVGTQSEASGPVSTAGIVDVAPAQPAAPSATQADVSPEPAPAPEAAKPTAETEPGAFWDLTDLYPNAEAWNADADAVEKQIAELPALKGTLGADANAMFAGLEKISLTYKAVVKLLVYATLSGDEDLRVAAGNERKQRIQTIFANFGEATSWQANEILAIGEAKVAEFQAANPELKRLFDFYLANILRAAPHTLSDEGETIMAAASDLTGQAGNVYEILSSAEMAYPTITLSTGEEARIDPASIAFYRQAPNRDDRKLVFDSFWGAHKTVEGTQGANLVAHIKGHIFNARMRHFPNSLSAALFPDNMPEAVYRQLVTQANAGLPSLHRYFKLRARMLGLPSQMGYYDIYPPLVNLEKVFTIEQSKEVTLAALAPLGEEYVSELRTGFSARWMHAYPQEGKASGAYMYGAVYDGHPYLFLNHNNDYEGLTTFAHEWGHAVHTQLTKHNQPWEKSDYATFTAETASIINEMLLQDYMVKNAQTPEEKLYYLGMALESMRGTFFRQTMFGEFELAIHEAVERGEPLSGTRISEMYCELLKRYHGDAENVVKIDPAYCTEWMYISHFYRNFYVYQYATSITGAAFLADRIVNGGPEQRENFLTVLRAGGSDYPYELYRRAGLDMAQPEPYQALIARMNRIMDEMEAILAAQPAAPAQP